VPAARNVVLVHGAFADGSGWEGVYQALRADGFGVGVSQHATISFAEDVKTVKRVIAAQNGPVVLVGHSYAGAVITEAGNDPNVVALVYINAFLPDAGESVALLTKDPVPGAPPPPLLPPQDGFLSLDKAKFPAAFAADLDPARAAFMADSQLPWGLEAVGGVITSAAWRSKPTWALIATEDMMIPAVAQRLMTGRAGAKTTEVAGSHAIYVSQPAAVAKLIVTAAKAVTS